MVVSMNTKVVYTTKANWLTGSIGTKHGDVMVGDKAFEFYNHRNPEDYIQIPWAEIEKVRAQMFLRDKYIRGFFIDTKRAGSFNFIVKNSGKCLKEMREFIGNDKIVRNKPVLSLKKLFRKKEALCQIRGMEKNRK